MNSEPPPGGGGAGKAAPPPTEWVEIIEPRSGEHMYANLTTGECVWDPPVGVAVKKTNDNQWWELFDQNTSRFYYYNATSQTTVWHRPADCDIIPLAKLQTLKQNTEVKSLAAAEAAASATKVGSDLEEHSESTLSPGKRRLKKQVQKHRRKVNEVQTEDSAPLAKFLPSSEASVEAVALSFAQTSPLPSPRLASRRRSHHHRHHHTRPKYDEMPPEMMSTSPLMMASDSRPLQTGGSLRLSSQSRISSLQSPPNSNRGLSKQRSLEGDQFKKQLIPVEIPQQEQQEVNPQPIARSVSFMSRRPSNHYDNYGPLGWKSSSISTSGRNSVESTPTTSRRSNPPSNGLSPEKNQSSPTAVEGYCTPLTHRRASIERPTPKPRISSKPVPNSKPVSSLSSAPPSHTSQHMSISELVDSGLTALGETKINTTAKKNGKSTSNASASNNMSPLQAYILEQAKLSGYDVDDRDSYVESDLDDRHTDSDDFADDEDGGCSDNLSKTSSSVEDDYLSEPTYNNLDPLWLQQLSKVHQAPTPKRPRPVPPVAPQIKPKPVEVDAFSEEFDLRMKIDRGGRAGSQQHYNNNGRNVTSSTMPRPASVQPQQPQNHNYPVPYEVLHPSLQRNAHSLMVDPMALQKASHSIHGGLQRGSSLSVTASIESDIEKYAQDNLNVQKRGLFRKRLSVKTILSWTTEAISKPLTCLPKAEGEKSSAKKEAVVAFRLIQIYMGDRKAKAGMTINSVALDITRLGYNKPSLRDEIFVQLSKQTTENPEKDSLRRGWELMAISLAFFPPSATFGPFLQGYIAKHRDPSLDEFPDAHKWPIHIQISHYAGICAKRLERMGDGGRLNPKKPSIEEIDQSRLLIFRPSMFFGTLSETMDVQRDRFPHLRLPWILTTMADQIMRLNGTGTEGIFRVPADLEEVQSLKSRFDQWEVVLCRDCHTAASLLKMWLRDLYEPLIPDAFYDECVALAINLDKEAVTNSEKSKRLASLVSRLPEINALVLMYLVRLLQLFAMPNVSLVTKMDDSNLATVFAPNCLRCPSNDPLTIMENTRKEMAFVKHMIQCLDTTVAEGIL